MAWFGENGRGTRGAEHATMDALDSLQQEMASWICPTS